MTLDNTPASSYRATGAHVLPFLSYLTLTVAASKSGPVYPWAYSGAVVATAGVCVWSARNQQTVKPHPRVLAAVAVGAVGIVLWIMLSTLNLEARLFELLPGWLVPARRVGFDPFAALDPAGRAVFLLARLLGLVVLTPWAEELFWRGFLARWLVSPDWESVPLGKFTRFSFAFIVLAFAAAHPEWLAAAAYGALLNGLLLMSKDLWKCIVAHAVSNLLLAAYVLQTGNWWLW